MPVSCSIKNCKSTKRKKNLEIRFYKFPFKNEKLMKYWVAATGRNNWIPDQNARICSLHFVNNDYYNDIESIKKRFLKPNVIPTQHVHTTILQVFEQDTVNKINEYNRNNLISKANLTNQQIGNHETTTILKHNSNTNVIVKEEWTNQQIGNNETTMMLKDNPNNNIIVKEEWPNQEIGNDETATMLKDNPNNEIIVKEEWTNQQIGNHETVISKCSNCLNYNNLLLENEKLRKIIEDLEILQEERLKQQAEMFHTLMRNNETVLKQKLEKIGKKNKTLNKNIKRKGQNITNLKTLCKMLKSKK